MKSSTLALVMLLALLACRQERLGPRAARISTVPLTAFSVADHVASLDTGECRPVTEYAPLRAVALVVSASGASVRRVLVAVDSTGQLQRYSDVRTGPSAVTVDANVRTGRGFVLDATKGIAHADAVTILTAENLGRPDAVARLVLQRCAAALENAGGQ